MNASKLMTPNPACCTPEATAQEVARLMETHDCGAIPVVDDRTTGRLVGMVTDRDLAIRAIAHGRDGTTPVHELMTADVASCGIDDDVDTVAKAMARNKVRRVPIVDGSGRPVGIVAQADLARAHRGVSDKEVGHVVEEISEPGARRSH